MGVAGLQDDGNINTFLLRLMGVMAHQTQRERHKVICCSFSSLQKLKSHRREDGSELPRLLPARLLIGWLKGYQREKTL